MIRKDILEEVIESQRKWILNLNQGIKRDDLEVININKNFALVISGIRRCGKSTFLSQILKKQKDFFYLNLEDPRLEGFDLKDFEKSNKIFNEKYGKQGIYFFDEIQNVPGWEKYIRFLTDRDKKILITGSNASLLGRELGTKLTGRHLRKELFPFSYNEFLKFNKLQNNEKSYEKYLFEGGFPEYLKNSDPTILHELLNDIVMRDIAVRFDIKNTSLLKKIAIFLITNPGKEFSYNSIKKSFEVKSVQTVINYISYFEDSYLLFTLPRFNYSYKKQQVSPKKIYSIDNGLSNANSVSFSKDKGKMLENQVFLSLRKTHFEIFYFKEKRECDFIIKEKNKIKTAIQVCYELNEENPERETNGLLEALEKFGLKKGLILTF
ncbi:MAG: ATP-binding protein, partial [Minisyncoccales bacterium]